MERNGRNWRAPVALITQTNKGRRWWTFGVERGGAGPVSLTGGVVTPRRRSVQ